MFYAVMLHGKVVNPRRIKNPLKYDIESKISSGILPNFKSMSCVTLVVNSSKSWIDFWNDVLFEKCRGIP
jgi:hypothetical protein